MKISKKTKSFAVKFLLCLAIFAVEILIALIEYDGTVSAGFWPQYLRHFFLPTLPFVVLYAVHDVLLVPVLMDRRNVPLYLSLTFLLVCIFSVYTFRCDDSGPSRRPESVEMKSPHPFGSRGDVRGNVLGDAPEDIGKGPHREDHGFRPEMDGAAGEPFAGGMSESPKNKPETDPGRGPDGRHIDKPDGMRPVHPAVFKIIMALLLLGVNIGIEYYKRYYAEKRRMQDLEKENLRYRLEYLRYQINPHFFMNTLNNIHALVDIAPEKAKESIVELSRLMRHVLYDSGDLTVSLSKEADFLKHYMYLMRLRYTENVEIEYSFPEDYGDAQIPPLLMATVAENAFKHGISYENRSYIRISVKVEGGKVEFKCVNSLAAQSSERKDGGIGLQNISKRLSLLYGDDFVLHIDRTKSQYEVLIIVPAQPRKIESELAKNE